MDNELKRLIVQALSLGGDNEPELTAMYQKLLTNDDFDLTDKRKKEFLRMLVRSRDNLQRRLDANIHEVARIDTKRKFMLSLLIPGKVTIS